jgi:protein-S-isoprenylcysteine O-methyltransferase Ste14
MRALATALKSAIFAAAFLAFWAWVALRMRVLDSALGGPLPSWTPLPGAVVLAAGIALGLGCVIWFVARGQGTPAPFDPPTRFVATGPYRWLRNPMYVGGVLMLAGLGLLTESPGVLLFAPIWWLLAHLFVTMYEEPNLRRRFGDSYARYCREVSRWLPKPPHHAPR